MSYAELPLDLAMYAEEILQDAQELGLRAPADFQATMTLPYQATPRVDLSFTPRRGDGSFEAHEQLAIVAKQIVMPVVQQYADGIISVAGEYAVEHPDWFAVHGSDRYDPNAKHLTGGQIALAAYFSSDPESYVGLNMQAARAADGELFSQTVKLVEADPELRRLTLITQCADCPVRVTADMTPNIDDTVADITRYFVDELGDLESASCLTSLANGNFGTRTDEVLTALRQDLEHRYDGNATVQAHLATVTGLYQAEQRRIADQFKNPDVGLIDWDTLNHCHDIIQQIVRAAE